MKTSGWNACRSSYLRTEKWTGQGRSGQETRPQSMNSPALFPSFVVYFLPTALLGVKDSPTASHSHKRPLYKVFFGLSREVEVEAAAQKVRNPPKLFLFLSPATAPDKTKPRSYMYLFHNEHADTQIEGILSNQRTMVQKVLRGEWSRYGKTNLYSQNYTTSPVFLKFFYFEIGLY